LRFREIRGEDTKRIKGAFKRLEDKSPIIPADKAILSGDQTFLKIEPTEELNKGSTVYSSAVFISWMAALCYLLLG